MKIFTYIILLYLFHFSYQGSSSSIEYTNECTLTKSTPVNVPILFLKIIAISQLKEML